MGALFICAGQETRVRPISATKAVAEWLFPNDAAAKSWPASQR